MDKNSRFEHKIKQKESIFYYANTRFYVLAITIPMVSSDQYSWVNDKKDKKRRK